VSPLLQPARRRNEAEADAAYGLFCMQAIRQTIDKDIQFLLNIIIQIGQSHRFYFES
jgi:hypothetical protein